MENNKIDLNSMKEKIQEVDQAIKRLKEFDQLHDKSPEGQLYRMGQAINDFSLSLENLVFYNRLLSARLGDVEQRLEALESGGE